MFAWFDWVKDQFVGGIEFFYNATGSHAWAIVLITVVIRVAIAPLFVVQMKSMKKMQELQPEVQRLREQYKGDAERMNKEMMELYRKHKVNPLAGCLPLLVQMPFLIAFYRVIFEFDYGPVAPTILGFIPLNAPDKTYILPVLSAGTTFLQSWLSQTGNEPTMKMMTYFMPLMIGWISVTVPAGVALYWVVSTVVGLVQQAIYPGFQKSLFKKAVTPAPAATEKRMEDSTGTRKGVRGGATPQEGKAGRSRQRGPKGEGRKK